MRFILFVITCSVIIMVSCSRKTNPSVANAAAKDSVAATVATTEPVIPQRPIEAPANQVEMVPAKIEPVTGSMADNEAGRVIYVTKCAKCHDAKPVDKWNQADWQPILKSMVKKSKLDSTENFQVRLYVNTHAKKD